MVDEAYLYYSDGVSAIDLVKEDKDLIVLRTFSKIFGMAGLRCGFAIARPDLRAKIERYSGTKYMPVTLAIAATSSLKQPRLVPERKQINVNIRQSVFESI
jgi:histidinol-phosphate aminotransferase